MREAASFKAIGGDLSRASNGLSNGRGLDFLGGLALRILVIMIVALGLEWPFRRVIGRLFHPEVDETPRDGPPRLTQMLVETLGVALFIPAAVGLYVVSVSDEPAARFFLISACAAVLLGRAGALASRWLADPRPRAARLIPIDDAIASALHPWLRAVLATSAYGWLMAQFLETAGISEGTHSLLSLLLGALVAVELAFMAFALRSRAEARLARMDQAALRRFAPLFSSFALAWISTIWVFWAIMFLAVGERSVAALVSLAAPAVLLFGGWRSWAGTLAAAGFAVAAILLWVYEADALLLHSSTLLLAATLAIGIGIWRLIEQALRPHLPKGAIPNEAPVARGRFQTLIPLVRIVLLFTLLGIGGLIALSALGIDTGPLLAGAGVIGLAVGFGSQSLVRDIITGLFFLLEDAFRIGEYVEVGHEKRGEVEAISLRSLRLRHHRGAVHTVPFGEIRTLTNHSRDWVIDKIIFVVEYDTDIEKLRRLVKKIGEDLAGDPAIGPLMLAPLKSQGVMNFAESGLIVRLKFTARPSHQFDVRREAMKRLHEAFREAGIGFATGRQHVTVTLDDDATALANIASAEMPSQPAGRPPIASVG